MLSRIRFQNLILHGIEQPSQRPLEINTDNNLKTQLDYEKFNQDLRYDVSARNIHAQLKRAAHSYPKWSDNIW